MDTTTITINFQETADILSDPETMVRLAKSMNDFRHSKLVEFDDV